MTLRDKKIMKSVKLNQRCGAWNQNLTLMLRMIFCVENYDSKLNVL